MPTGQTTLTLSGTALLSAVPAFALPPSVGVPVENTADVSVVSQSAGGVERLTTNTVLNPVGRLVRFRLDQDQAYVRAPGETALFTFVITNTGNDTTLFETGFDAQPGDFDFALTEGWFDRNANGRIDVGDTRFDDGAAIQLAAGARAQVLVRVQVPAGATNGQVAAGVLVAEPSDGGAPTQGVRGEVIVRTAALSLTKTASETEVSPGEPILYTLSLRNNSAVDFDPASDPGTASILVDGASVRALLIRDPLPPNVDFAKIVDPVDFQTVYQLVDDPETSWRTDFGDDVGKVAAVALLSRDVFAAGESRDFTFEVIADPNSAGARLDNTAYVAVGSAGPSNTVSTRVIGTGAQRSTIEIFPVDGFVRPASRVRAGEPLTVELVSGLCNTSRSVDVITLTLRTVPDGDVERVQATETGPDTGVFRTGAVSTELAPPVVADDGRLQSRRGGEVNVEADCAPGLIDSVPVSPSGVVFSSVTNAPVFGARVDLLNASGQIVATDWSDADGVFEIDMSSSGLGQIVVTPPEGLTYPSGRRAFASFGRRIDPAASFAFPFQQAAGTALAFDVPVDPLTDGLLVVAKSVERARVETGDVITYTVEIANRSALSILEAEIVDTLPRGFGYVSGSGALDGIALSDPEIDGEQLVWSLNRIAPGSRLELTYSAIVTPGAGEGWHINRVFLRGRSEGILSDVVSNQAEAAVEVDDRGGAFSRDAVLLGKVFVDCDGDGRQSGDMERGVPGVEFALDDGTQVRTDRDGQFAIDGLRPVTRVIAMRTSSLPDGAGISAQRVMDAGSRRSRFVPLAAGQVRAETFALTGCSADLDARVRARIDAFDQTALGWPDAARMLSLEPVRPLQRSESDAAQPMRNNRLEGGTSGTEEPVLDEVVLRPLLDIAATRDLSVLGSTAPDELSFLDIEDGAMIARRSASVRVAVPEGLRAELRVNGKLQPASRVGQRLRLESGERLEFVAIPFEPGVNTLELVGFDSFGNARQSRTVTLEAPGDPVKLRILAPEEVEAIRGQSVAIWIEAVDDRGVPVAAPVELTLQTDNGRIDTVDSRPDQAGVQVDMFSGRVRLDYLPSGEVGQDRIEVSSRFGRTETRLRLVTGRSREPIIVGMLEGVVSGVSGDDMGALLETDRLGLFEDTVEGVNGALFAQGNITEDTRLTVRVDTDRGRDDFLFRDVSPDVGYPVFGDQSEVGFEAQSRGRVFARLERGASRIGFGDSVFAPEDRALQLGGERRVLEGLTARSEAGRIRMNAYVGETDTGQHIVELPSRGLSGPYSLGAEDILRNSERVELITRDRNQPGLILDIQPLKRFEDYSLDYFNGAILFPRAIPLRDADLNPVSIRVTFETGDGQGEDYLVYGGELAFDLSSWMRAGARVLSSNAPEADPDRRSILAGYVAAQLARGDIEFELARSESPEGSDEAWRLDYSGEVGPARVSMRATSAGEKFVAPSAPATAGRTDMSAKADVSLTETREAGIELLYSEDAKTDSTRAGLAFRIEDRLSDTVSARVGSRAVRTEGPVLSGSDALTVIAGLTWVPSTETGTRVDVEIEQDTLDPDNRALRFGVDHMVSERLGLYATGEFAGSRTGTFGIGERTGFDATLRAGVDYRVNEALRAFSEYRARDTLFDSGIASGFSAGWNLTDASRLRARFERVQPLAEDYPGVVAASVGATIEDDTGDWIVDGDIEYAAEENDRQSWYLSQMFGRRWEDVTLLIRNRLAITTRPEQRVRDRLRLGWAHRPPQDDQLNTLAWYEFSVDERPGNREVRQTWSFGGERKVEDDLRLRGRFAGQYLSLTTPAMDADFVTLMLQLGGDRDVGKRLNLAANASVFTDGRFENQTFGLGGEVNFVLRENALVGLGYSYAELDEERLRGLYRKGFYLRFRVKFDHDVWSIFDGD